MVIAVRLDLDAGLGRVVTKTWTQVVVNGQTPDETQAFLRQIMGDLADVVRGMRMGDAEFAVLRVVA